jgi:GT2 family glycosyltransferase/glycosyltransferase involved in cell wall biosynthesis
MPDEAASEQSVAALTRSALSQGLLALSQADRRTALRWLERAHRLLPDDPNTTLALASACVEADPGRAEALFRAVAGRYDVRQAWLGLAAATFRLNGPAAAAEPLANALSRHVFDAQAAPLADQIGLATGAPGWCGLTSNGALHIRAARGARVQVRLDGVRASSESLPEGWSRARRVDVSAGRHPLLGSPIRIDIIRRVSGCVEVFEAGIRGWAWHPADPGRPAELTLDYASGGQQTITANDETIAVPDTGPLAHPRSFHLTRGELLDPPGLVHVRGPDGKDLLGSPLNPAAEAALRVAEALRLADAYPADRLHHIPGSTHPAPHQPIGAGTRKHATTVVVPVHNGTKVTLASLASVLASKLIDARLLVIDDGSTDPVLVAALDELAGQRKIELLRHQAALGFTASANAGIRAAHGRDVVLLNSDTLVPHGWLGRLRDAAYAAHDIGTVTPLSNDATILSYPGTAGTNPLPDQASTDHLDRLAERANARTLIDIPVGIGFCLFLRRDCLNAVGSFRADQFAQGYGEENDFCLRAHTLGWRNVALTGLFVGHVGGTSFGSDAVHLRARNGKLLEQLHPGQHARIQDFIARDPLAEPRRRIDLLRWREPARIHRESAILVTHNDGGGVEARIADAVRGHQADGRRAIVLRPAKTAGDEPAIAVRDGISDDFANLVYAIPRELPALLRLLRSTRPIGQEVHSFLGHPPEIFDVVARLAAPYEVHVHDYAWFCPRVSLVGGFRRYCGEPDLHQCEACVADFGTFLNEDITVAALRSRSAAFLASAHRVVAPSVDAGYRIKRHFPDLSPVIVPHENDALITAPARSHMVTNSPVRVCVVGAIGLHKGYDVLLACARDAARRLLDLEFVVVGHTIDDARMMATGRVFVTGRFAPEEAVGLIAAQNAQLGFVTSIWPETWCLSLGDIWRAGLQAAAFDIGTPAERIKQSGRGILLPLGLSPGAINNALIAAVGAVVK